MECNQQADELVENAAPVEEEVAATPVAAATTRNRECSLASVVSAAASSDQSNSAVDASHRKAVAGESSTTVSHRSSSVGKIVSQNYNGTMVLTSSPNNEAELQLYRVMQRASLLAYYDTLLEMGGDDVQQLCDAGEEEFLEIMALVGMASKPLHVRRFQKALQEWITNPIIFQSPLIPSTGNTYPLPRSLSAANNGSNLINSTSSFATNQSITPASSPSSSVVQQLGEISSCTPATSASPVCSVSPGPSPGSPLPMQHHLTPVLDEIQIYRLEESAKLLAMNLPELEPKYHNAKKKVSKEVEAILNMPEDNPERMNQIRKYSAIYGRFDCKRKPEKPLTLHEVSVNEAAAQICRYIPALLTRRDELFPLARQVVRDSGYHYSKGHSKSSSNQYFRGNFSDLYAMDQLSLRKRWKSDGYPDSTETSISYKQHRMEQIAIEIQQVSEKLDDLTKELSNSDENTSQYLSIKYQRDILQSKQNQLLLERSSLQNSCATKRRNNGSGRRKYSGSIADSEKQDTDETDSQFSYSNAGSPYQMLPLYHEITNDLQDPMENKDFMNQELEAIGRDVPDKPFEQDDSSMDDNKEETMSSIKRMKRQNSAKQEASDSSDSDYNRYYTNQVQVVASKGDNIIAVTNPALLTTHDITMKQERLSPVNSNSEKDN